MIKHNIHYIIFIIMIAGCLCIGLISKHSHRDVKDDLDFFYVGVMDEDLVEMAIDNMKQSLDDNKYILIVTCKGGLEFGFSYGSQKVVVDTVIKSQGDIAEGDVIDIRKINTVYTPADELETDRAFNMEFVNALTIGRQYLIFLDERVELEHGDVLYMRNEDYLATPYFPVDGTQAEPVTKELEDDSSALYGHVKENDVFITSEAGVEAWSDFTDELIRTYVK